MKPWHLVVAGAVAGILAMWFLTPRPGPDTTLLDALRDSVAEARATVTRDSARLAVVDDSLAAYRDTVVVVTHRAHQAAAAASKRAAVAEGRVRAILDSLGASVEALDDLVAAHAQEIAAKDAEIAAVAQERSILYRRVELSDSLIGSMRGQLSRQAAVDAEKDRIMRALGGKYRNAKIRERAAEAVAVAAIVWKVVG